MPRELGEHVLALRGELDQHAPPIFLAAAPPHELPRLEPVQQLDRAVVPELQPVGQVADGHFLIWWCALRGEQELMLLRLEPRRACGVFTETQE